MSKVDPPLVIHIVSRHVRCADRVVDALARPAHGGDDEVAWLELGDRGSNLFDLTEPFVAGHQEVVSLRRRAVFGGVDFLVRAIDADAQHANQYAAAVGDVAHRGFLELGEME